MDEKALRTMFRDADEAPPPASFDAADIAHASARQRARQRTRMTLASGLAGVVLVAGGLLASEAGMLSRGEQGQPVAVQPPKFGMNSGQPQQRPGRPYSEGKPSGFPPPTPMQGGEGNGKTGPLGAGSTPGCDTVDRELATALAGELPVRPTGPARKGGPCDPGVRSAGYDINDGPNRGLVIASVIPKGSGAALPPAPQGTFLAKRPARSGASLVLWADPATGADRAPYYDQLTAVADRLASRF